MSGRLLTRLRVISLFEDLPDPLLETIDRHCSTRAYERGATIVEEADATTDVFFILAGSVRIGSTSETGREIILADLDQGAMFGEFAAIDGLPRSARVHALADCTLSRMTSIHFYDLLKANSEISIRLIEVLVAKVRYMSERVFEVSTLAVRERIRRELLRLASETPPNEDGIIAIVAPTHYEIAARIGSHREAVTRELNRLENERLVRVGRRHIEIFDIEQFAQPDRQ